MIYVPELLVTIPVIRGIKDIRYTERGRVENALSPKAYITLLLALRRGSFGVTSKELGEFLSRPAEAIHQIADEIEKCTLNGSKLFRTELTKMGRTCLLSIQANEIFRSDNYIGLREEDLKRCSMHHPYDILTLLLLAPIPRFPWIHYCDFLLLHYYGGTIERFKKAKGVKSVYPKAGRYFNYILQSFSKFGINVQYELTRVPLGNLSIKFFRYIEILGRE